jgi:hypothetical protein
MGRLKTAKLLAKPANAIAGQRIRNKRQIVLLVMEKGSYLIGKQREGDRENRDR